MRASFFRLRRSLRSPLRMAPGLLALSLSACGVAEAPARSGDGWVLGVTGPFDKPWGQEMLLGARLAAEEINRAGGVAGRSIVLVEEDDGGDPQRAIGVAERFVSDSRIRAVVGPMTSGSTLKAAGVYSGKVPAVATSATSPQLSGLSPWVFRMIPDDRAIAAAGARFATSMLGARRAAVLYTNDDYGRDLAAAFRSALEEQGAEVVAADPYLEEMGDFTPYLRRIRERGPEMIFVAGVAGSAGRIVEQARGLGLNLPVVGGDAITALASGGSAGAIFGSVAYHPGTETSANREFVRLFRAAHGRDPSPEAAPAYDAVRLLAQVIEGGARTPTQVRDALQQIGAGGGSPFDAVSGSLRFDEFNDVAGLPLQVVRVHPGRLELVSSVSAGQ